VSGHCSCRGSTLAGNDALPLLISGLESGIDVVRCQEIFDYAVDEHRTPSATDDGMRAGCGT
jgi:hypothetical protein